jgi:hypothetical protein
MRNYVIAALVSLPTFAADAQLEALGRWTT